MGRIEFQEREPLGGELKMEDSLIEDIDDAWFWQLTEKRKNLPQLRLPRNRYG